MKVFVYWIVCCCCLFTSGCDQKSLLDRVCGHEEDCGIDPDECRKIWGKMVITSACANAQVKTPCEELFNTNSDFWDVCFPPCTPPGDSHCEGDIQYMCEQQQIDEGSEVVIDCAKHCEIEGLQGGTCGEIPTGTYEFGCICE